MKDRLVILLTLLCVAFVGMPALAQDAAVECERFLDMKDDDAEYTKIKVSPALFGAIGGGIAGLMGDAEDIGDIVERITSMNLVTFSLDVSEVAARDRVKGLGKSLAKRGWDTIVEVQDGNDSTYVLTLSDAKSILGMTVLVIDGSDFTCVNFTGALHSSDLETIVETFGGQ